MSRIGKKSIKIPAGVEIKIDGSLILVKGPKGELKREFLPGVDFKIENNLAFVSAKDDSKRIWGLSRALLNNMIKGVSEGFSEILEFSGVGFKAQIKGQDLELSLGFTNPIVVKGQEGIAFQVDKGSIKITGIDKEAVGHVAASVRAARPPEPYKGTGVKYQSEVIRRKAGKKAVAGGA